MTMAFTLRSIAFETGTSIPRVHTCDGRDVSPALRWDSSPPGTQSFALVCEDPDAPAGTWTHWVIYGIPEKLRQLPEGVPPEGTLPDGTAQGKNDFGRLGYGGPCPPRGRPHRYFFRLYALDERPPLAPGLSRKGLLEALKGHVLAQAELYGLYGRP
jgi:Raf kinase inhibitor-like YbhB/YbcL family protein